MLIVMILISLGDFDLYFYVGCLLLRIMIFFLWFVVEWKDMFSKFWVKFNLKKYI